MYHVVVSQYVYLNLIRNYVEYIDRNDKKEDYVSILIALHYLDPANVGLLDWDYSFKKAIYNARSHKQRLLKLNPNQSRKGEAAPYMVGCSYSSP